MSPGLRCHCGRPDRPVLTRSDDRRSCWYECQGCGFQAPSVAWDGSVGATLQAAALWDDTCARIRRGVGLPVRGIQVDYLNLTKARYGPQLQPLTTRRRP